MHLCIILKVLKQFKNWVLLNLKNTDILPIILTPLGSHILVILLTHKVKNKPFNAVKNCSRPNVMLLSQTGKTIRKVLRLTGRDQGY